MPILTISMPMDNLHVRLNFNLSKEKGTMQTDNS
jgi:hypothetical protein